MAGLGTALSALNLATNLSDVRQKTKGYMAQQKAARIHAPLPAGGIPEMRKVSALRAMRYFLSKQAGGPDPISAGTFLKNIPAALGLGAAMAGGGMAVGAAARGVGGIYQKFVAERMFKELQQRYPEIRNKPQEARKYFELIVAYAPSLLRHHAAIGDFLRRQLEYPMSSVEFIKQLADLEATVSKTHGESASAHFGRSASEAGGGMLGSLAAPQKSQQGKGSQKVGP
jgi:hypothetical protein